MTETTSTAPRLRGGLPLPPTAAEHAVRIVADGVPGVTIVVAGDDGPISTVDVGDISAATQYPIASASKWLAAATVMTLVDAGTLALDLPVATWLPGGGPIAERVTLRHLLSQTSGIVGPGTPFYDLEQDHRLTMTQAATEILRHPLATEPGRVFVYGGPGFQIAGAVVEQVTGQGWEDAFRQRIAEPLGMSQTYWTHLKLGREQPVPVSETTNPVLQGGAVSTADDYMRFLGMVHHGGILDGRRVLSEHWVDEMLRDQFVGATLLPTDSVVLADSHYGLGNWCEQWDEGGRGTRNSSLGAFGTYPWCDRASGLHGLFFMYETSNAFRVWPHLDEIRAEVIAARGGR